MSNVPTSPGMYWVILLADEAAGIPASIFYNGIAFVTRESPFLDISLYDFKGDWCGQSPKAVFEWGPEITPPSQETY